MVARFTINAVPALAVLDRGGPTDHDGVPVPAWDSIHSSVTAKPALRAGPVEAIVPLVYDRRAAARKAAKKRDGAVCAVQGFMSCARGAMAGSAVALPGTRRYVD
jgi:hypothetical protein